MIAIRQSIPAAALCVPMCACMPMHLLDGACLPQSVRICNIVKLYSDYNFNSIYIYIYIYIHSTLISWHFTGINLCAPFCVVHIVHYCHAISSFIHMYTDFLYMCCNCMQAQTQHAQFKHYRVL